MDWLGIGAVNGGLIWGTLFIASPILIHLLNRRKFRVVDWAAMDFLLDAERRNRRRIRLEHLILLILRCLAVILVAFLTARLFFQPTGWMGRAVDSPRVDRIVLLDDSPSMEARRGAKTVFEEAVAGLTEFVRQTGRHHPGDTLTLLITSQPERPVLAGQYLAGEKGDHAARIIQNLSVTDRSAAYAVALGTIEQLVSSGPKTLNRTLTILTDLRRRDWQAAVAADGDAAGPASGRGVLPLLKRVAEKVNGISVVDVGGPRVPNVAVTDIALRDPALVAGVPARFEVTLANYGDAAAGPLPVIFQAGDSAPLRAEIQTIEPGGRAAVPFTFTFRELGVAPVRAEIPPDAVPRDNARHRAARVRPGVPILLVDGEPAGEHGEAESFYLHRALDPPGPAPSGNDVEVVAENQFEDLALDRFQVIILANLYRVTENRVRALERWVRAGGGLIVFLGDQVDEAAYNERFFAGGAGLFPLRLSAVAGDETQRKWVHLQVSDANHPVLRVFEGADNPFLKRVKVYRWWAGAVRREDVAAGRVHVLAAYTDPEASPALVERRHGDGRVLAVTTSADAEWTGWPADPSYLVTVLEMVRHVTRPSPDAGAIAVGTPIRLDLDPARFAGDVQVEPPDKAVVAIQAAPSDDGRTLRLEFEQTGRSGFYALRLRRHDGSVETDRVAANVEPTEGDLRPADRDALRRETSDARIAWLEGRDYLARGADGARTELWRTLLIALVLVLGVESLLAWWFGRSR
jgi:hypothetical protein